MSSLKGDGKGWVLRDKSDGNFYTGDPRSGYRWGRPETIYSTIEEAQEAMAVFYLHATAHESYRILPYRSDADWL
jgi:hypothetical protein